MSYSIIFSTKITSLPDGRIIWFKRTGCNNDDCGRKKSEFTAEIYNSKEEFAEYAERFKKGSKPYKKSENFDLKINSRYATYYDYGEHLLRMLKRSEDFNKFINHHAFLATHYLGAEVYEPEHKILNLNDFSELWYKNLNTRMVYRMIIEYPKTAEEIVSSIESDAENMTFYIN